MVCDGITETLVSVASCLCGLTLSHRVFCEARRTSTQRTGSGWIYIYTYIQTASASRTVESRQNALSISVTIHHHRWILFCRFCLAENAFFAVRTLSMPPVRVRLDPCPRGATAQEPCVRLHTGTHLSSTARRKSSIPDAHTIIYHFSSKASWQLALISLAQFI